MDISLIITTAPGREGNLNLCLQQIRRQSLQPQEVIIVDDGSTHGHTIASSFKDAFSLTFSWKPNSCNVAHSRNIGAQLARGELLIFIDSDILLNPGAIESYRDYFSSHRKHILYGYYGTLKHIKAPSLWFPGQWVNWMDERFVFETSEKIESPGDIFQAPHQYGWSGNFALLKRTYEVVNFNEQLIGWGFEDIDFASRAIQKGCDIHFSLDAWGEHMVHDLKDPFHQISNRVEIERGKRVLALNYRDTILPINYSLNLCDEKVEYLLTSIFQHYYPQSITPNSV